ncbi:Rrf2 family transcriptional regulator [Paralimibaculum aggregatum]|uniref:Rrf2 family transcriptional regulator n=1 Tax=Paralimibaculum aggregatum TaxID=3036245 RepID=A0ABQ6LRC4_9RHOB|nr:Rrf2 family transcriptional regulator [Limibaculum sp. NKW23]GMG83575.1 Rrf2 family transcriptional regulator [Limibaculum sp. NKW23]
MKLSTKGRYAVTALADIALNTGQDPVSLGDISGRQDISLAYLEQLFVRLRRAGLVTSIRGPGGGYRLARDPARISIAEIMAAVDERLNAMGCEGKSGVQGCGSTREVCLTHTLWEQLSAHVHVFLAQTSIADVIAERLSPCPAVPDFAAILDEDDDAPAPAAGGAAEARA